MDVQMALFLERSKVLSKWNDSVSAVKEHYDKGWFLGKQEVSTYLPLFQVIGNGK